MNARLAGTDELAALIPQVATALELNVAYVEKDFWAMESLRAMTLFCDERGAPAIFKGGTSLSRGWGLTRRFSEDIDIVLDFPDAMGKGTRDSILKGIAGAVREHLALAEGSTIESDSSTGVKRNIRVQYPVSFQFTSPELKEHVLLEVGSRGAASPSENRFLRSLVADFVVDNAMAQQDEFVELSPFEVHLLAPERTLIEKIALLATQDDKFRRGDQEAFATRGRHLYDIHQVLGSAPVLTALDAMGPTNIAAESDDVVARSARAGWDCVERPAQGWIELTTCYRDGTPAAAGLKAAYEAAEPLFYGDAPTFADCINRVQEFSGRL